jgi:hypothetical protein
MGSSHEVMKTARRIRFKHEEITELLGIRTLPIVRILNN